MRLKPNRKVIAWVLIGSIVCLPAQPMWAAVPAGSSSPDRAVMTVPIRDVALQAGGILRGQVVDRQGKACTGAAISLVKVGATAEKPLTAQTDREGRFHFDGVSAGVYQVATTEGGALCRLWAPAAAPPAAVPAALVVQGEGPVRGALPSLSNISPLGWTLIGLGVAAAIAIPLALHKDNSDGS